MKTVVFKILICVTVLLCALKARTQSRVIDSLQKKIQGEKEDSNKVKMLKALAWAFLQKTDYTNALRIAGSAVSLAQKIKFRQGEEDAYTCIGQTYYLQYNYTSALTNFSNALKISLESGDKNRIAYSYLNVSSVYYDLGIYPDALKNAFLFLKYCEGSGDKKSINLAYSQIAACYISGDDLSESLKYNFLLLKSGTESNDSSSIGSALTQIGDIYFKQNRYDDAIEKYTDAVKIMRDTGNLQNKVFLGNTYSGIGDVYHHKARTLLATDKAKANAYFSEALKNYFFSAKIYKEAGFEGGFVNDYIPIGEVFISTGKMADAAKYLKESFLLAKKTRTREDIRESYRGLEELDSATGNYKQAYEDYKMYILYRDSLNNESTLKRSLAYSMQFEADKKEAASKIDQAKKDAEAKRIKNREYFIISSLAILVVAGIIIALIQFRNNKQKQKANLLLERQKQKVETTLTELKSTQSQLIQSEKMASLGELTAGIAHEIQNPLNFVNNFSEVNKELLVEAKDEMQKGNYDDAKEIIEDVIGNSEKINHHGKRADAIVKGMLQHSRTGTGAKEPTDINKLADEYLRLAYHGLRAKDKDFNATLKTDYDESIPLINIVPQDIGRVLLNLITNAFYAVAERGKLLAVSYEPLVSVSTKKGNNNVQITVTDNGSGIPQNIIDKIFQPFFTTKPTGQGTGLGLSLAYDIVKAHGGELLVESRGKVETKEGEGTSFIINLPV